MDPLHFALNFFQFSSKQWKKIPTGHPSQKAWVEKLFSELTPRVLKCGPVKNAEQALSLYKEICQEEYSLGVRALKVKSAEYPSQLEKYLAPEKLPQLLFLRGAKIPAESEIVAIVGTRTPSQGGIRAAKDFASFLTAQKLHIISGLARGIDAIAHEKNLNNGTIAVLGSGVGEVYPSEHQSLAEKILALGGTIVSQFPLWQVPLPQNFPQRNEIISALAAGTIVIEGSEKSGAAITGKLCLDMDKTSVVLTQDFRSAYGRGAIRLQQCGATLVANEEEALHALFLRFGGFPWNVSHPNTPKSSRSFNFEEFQSLANIPISDAIALLEEGLRKGRIERIGSDTYCFRRTPNKT